MATSRPALLLCVVALAAADSGGSGPGAFHPGGAGPGAFHPGGSAGGFGNSFPSGGGAGGFPGGSGVGAQFFSSSSRYGPPHGYHDGVEYSGKKSGYGHSCTGGGNGYQCKNPHDGEYGPHANSHTLGRLSSGYDVPYKKPHVGYDDDPYKNNGGYKYTQNYKPPNGYDSNKKQYNGYNDDPYKYKTGYNNDPYKQNNGYNDDPYKHKSGYNNDPHKQNGGYNNDPYKHQSGYDNDPYKHKSGYNNDPYKHKSGYNNDPYKQNGGYNNNPYKQNDGYNNDPYKHKSGYNSDPYKQDGYKDDPYKKPAGYSSFSYKGSQNEGLSSAGFASGPSSGGAGILGSTYGRLQLGSGAGGLRSFQGTPGGAPVFPGAIGGAGPPFQGPFSSGGYFF